jgi:hypothetical protein
MNGDTENNLRSRGFDRVASDALLFRQRSSELLFRFVKGGEYLMGFSNTEEEQAKRISEILYMTPSEMRPVHSIQVKVLLVAIVPLTWRVAAKLLGDVSDVPKGKEHYVAYLKRESAEKCLTDLGARMPTEEEWEYFCRAGSAELFTFGSELPAEEELFTWLNPDCGDPSKLASNNFGLLSLFNGEWCQDLYRENYAPDAQVLQDLHVVRGGGAYFWPWQDQEWLWCASAMRCPSSDLIDDESCVRPVGDITI